MGVLGSPTYFYGNGCDVGKTGLDDGVEQGDRDQTTNSFKTLQVLPNNRSLGPEYFSGPRL